MMTESPSGDVRDAWQNQKVEPFRMSPGEIRKKIGQFDKKIRRRNFIVFAVCFFEIACFSCFYFIFPNLIQRIGALLTVLGMGYLVYQVRLNQLQKREAGITVAKVGKEASVDFYRAELQRQRDFHCGIWFWSRLVMIVPGPLVFFVGFELAYPVLATYIRWEAATFLFFAALAIPLNLRLARKYQKQIEELETLMKES
jgi:hypothetical protein